MVIIYLNEAEVLIPITSSFNASIGTDRKQMYLKTGLDYFNIN